MLGWVPVAFLAWFNSELASLLIYLDAFHVIGSSSVIWHAIVDGVNIWESADLFNFQ